MSIKFSVLLLCLALSNASGQNASINRRSVPPKEVAGLAGTYRGTWSMYGIDEEGTPQKRASWTDVMTASEPVLESGRAFVSTVDDMTFEGGRIPPMKITGKEGYFVATDGTLGEYFIEAKGQVYHVSKVGKNVWVYTAGASPQELSQLGFKDGLWGQHTLIKLVTEEEGIETHRITRISTVNWHDNSGKNRWIQYVSLEGVHRREVQPRAE